MAIGEQRAWSRAAMPELVARGLGSNAIVRQLKDWGLGKYRRAVMLSDIREFTGLHKLERAVRLIDAYKPAPRHVMVETELRRDRRYRVFGKMEVFNQLTGETEDQIISFYDDENLGKKQWIERFQDQFYAMQYDPQRIITKTEITAIEHQKGWKF